MSRFGSLMGTAMFFKASNGVSYPISRIRSFLENYAREEVVVELDDGTSIRVDAGAWDQSVRRTGQACVPALAGFNLLCPVIHDDGSETYDKEPIVAWLLNALGELLPATVEGPDLDARAILLPNGEVVEANICSYETLEKYAATKDVTT